MWTFRKVLKQPAAPRFAVGEAVFYQINELGPVFEGVVRSVDCSKRMQYIVELHSGKNSLHSHMEVEERLMRPRPVLTTLPALSTNGER